MLMVVENCGSSPSRLSYHSSIPSSPARPRHHSFSNLLAVVSTGNNSIKNTDSLSPVKDTGSVSKLTGSHWGDMEFPGQLPAGVSIPNSAGNSYLI